ncbi:hypothetical protein, partial [Rosenbergiella australiborealis]
MLIISTILDADETRWIEPIKGLKLKIGSVNSPAYSSTMAYVRRHINEVSQQLKVGSKDFNIDAISDIDSPDDLLMQPVARYLMLDWKGVGEVIDGKEVPIDYTPERGLALLKQEPQVYWSVITSSSKFSKEIEEAKADTVGKSS